jgi:hypothetical protein
MKFDAKLTTLFEFGKKKAKKIMLAYYFFKIVEKTNPYEEGEKL